MERDADVVVIGSGAGGMAAAVALANHGKRVIVCEQHEVPGGWCHSFRVHGHRFSPGVHYLGALGEGQPLRRIYEGLGVSEDLTFFQLNPEGFEHYRLGALSFDQPAGVERFAARLAELAPEEARGIDAYLRLVKQVSSELGAIERMHGLWDALSIPYRARHLGRYGLVSLARVLRAHVDDPRVRSILAAQVGDHGLPPTRAPFVLHALLARHYFDGAYYPKGGGGGIPKAFARQLRRRGGEILLSTEVERILLARGRAVGVRLADGRELCAEHVVSNADPQITYGRLIGDEHLPARLQKKLGATRYSVASIGLFFALDLDLEKLGYDSGNYWWAESGDFDAVCAAALAEDALARETLPAIFLTITSLKDRTHRELLPTLEAFAFVPYAPFARWEGSDLGARPPDYEALKQHLTAAMLRTVERLIPGAREHVVFAELGTPLTNWHYVRATQGNMYGTEKSRGQLGPFAFPVVTAFRGLRHCGASTLSHGVMGATLSGLAAARSILRVDEAALLSQGGPPLATYPADHPERWPEAMRREIRAQEPAQISDKNSTAGTVTSAGSKRQSPQTM